MPHRSLSDGQTVTPALLRAWPLPDAGGGKEARGRTLIVGGTPETPGAVLLAAEAALRAGAGKLQVATAAPVATQVAVALPEALVRGVPVDRLSEAEHDALDGLRELASDASSVLVGPGLADPTETAHLVRSILPAVSGALAVDALGLAALTDDIGCLRGHRGGLVLTPNPGEAAKTLHVEVGQVEADPASAARTMAQQSGAVVALGGEVTWVATPDGDEWSDPSGGAGLGVSGAGDVRAGVVAGLLARGAEPAQAAVWAAHLHGCAGERLASTVGPVGFLARDLAGQLPALLAEIQQ
jgi:ADP-dependent NAD(P)H-hydrate dehydratase